MVEIWQLRTESFPHKANYPEIRKCSNFEVSGIIFQPLASIFVLHEMINVITIRILSSASHFCTFGKSRFLFR